MTTVTAQSPPPPPPPSFSSRSTTQTTNASHEQSPPPPPPLPPPSSFSSRSTTNASHEFLIEGYSLTKGMGIGKHIASDVFTAGGYQWAIYFYPDGKNPNDKSEFVSVYVTLESEGSNVRALFELKLLDQSGQGKHKVHSHFVPGPCTLKQKGSMWGYKRYFRRALLERSDFLKNDCLKFNCTVGVVISATDCPRLNSIHVPESDIGSPFGAPLENKEGSDVTIDVASDASDTTEPTIDISDWRTQIQPDQRQRIVNKIADSLRKFRPVSGSDGLLQLQNISERFEDKMYTVATSQSDYLRKISMKMLTMENNYKNIVGNNKSSNEGGPSNNPPDQGQQHPNPLPSQHQISQTIQNNVAPQSNLPSVSALPQIPIQNISQNSNTQQPGQDSMSNSNTIDQNSNVQSMFPDSQRQMPGRQQVVLQQQQQQSLNQQQILHQQQNLLQPNQLQSSQQFAMQPLMMQSSLASLLQNQQQILYQQQLMNYNLSHMLQQQHQQQQNILQANQLQSSQQSVVQTSSAMQSLMQSSVSSLQQHQHQLLKHKLSQMLQQQHQQQLMMIMLMIMMTLMMMVVMMMI